MSDYHCFSLDARTARKPHVCIWCGEGIPKGAAYHDERSVYDGRHQRHRWHPECMIALKRHDEMEFDPYENPRGENSA